MKKFFRRRIVWIYLGSVAGFFLILFAVAIYLSHRREANFSRVQIGNTKAEVRALLGEPTIITTNVGFLFIDHREHWCYGSWLQPNYPFIRIRLFGPGDDEFVLIFSAGQVAEIKKPK